MSGMLWRVQSYILPAKDEDRKRDRKMADPWGRWQLLLGEFLKGSFPKKHTAC